MTTLDVTLSSAIVVSVIGGIVSIVVSVIGGKCVLACKREERIAKHEVAVRKERLDDG